MNNFSGFQKKNSYFEGWYLKHQSKDLSIALIPAFHIDEKGNKTASIQVITNSGSYHFPFTKKHFFASKKHFYVKIDNNVFSDKGISINLKNEMIEISGTIRYSPFTQLQTDIMGPFHYIPFMQCNHGILSMLHRLSGSFIINGDVYDFSNGVGYIEKDYGSSFPEYYTWTHCGDWTGKQDCSLTAAAAHIPFGLLTFTGCICAIWHHGREYRLATYLGARIVKNTPYELMIKQGRYKLRIIRLDTNKINKNDRNLYAPEKGSMHRIIKENIACRVRYRFTKSQKVVFDFTSSQASFESVYTPDS